MAQLNFGGTEETVVTREEFPLSKAQQVLKNEVVAVIGYGVQGPGQALNQKDNGINVIVGQRKNSKTWDKAVRDGFVPGVSLFEIEEALGAHFYLAYVGSAWTPLGSPALSNLEWSIVTMIDLRKRPDGLTNTSPASNVVSPQYVIVNHTTNIPIPVSDANLSDAIRCRWSVFTSGYRRRRRDPHADTTSIDRHSYPIVEKFPNGNEAIHIRNKRMHLCSQCAATCVYRCQCSCSVCIGTNCTGSTCSSRTGCLSLGTTTLETPGTLQSTSTYPSRQAINECGGICYPNSVPNGTKLSSCTLSFRGLVPDTWYAVSIQVCSSIDIA